MSKLKTKDGLPQEYLDLVGTKQTVSGCVFSYEKEIEPQEFDVLDIRRGSARMIDYNKMEVTNLSYELLLKNDSMKRAQWSKPFPDMITEVTDTEI